MRGQGGERKSHVARSGGKAKLSEYEPGRRRWGRRQWRAFITPKKKNEVALFLMVHTRKEEGNSEK